MIKYHLFHWSQTWEGTNILSVIREKFWRRLLTDFYESNQPVSSWHMVSVLQVSTCKNDVFVHDRFIQGHGRGY